MFEYRAEVLRVVDGDTLDILVDLGFAIYTKQRVRLQHLNSPEKNTAAGKASLAWLRERLPVGTKITVRSEKPGAGDKYGRYLAVVLDIQGDVNAALIASGHALSWEGQGAKPV